MKIINVEEMKVEYRGKTEDEQVELMQSIMGGMIMAQMELQKNLKPEEESKAMLTVAECFAKMHVLKELEIETKSEVK